MTEFKITVGGEVIIHAPELGLLVNALGHLNGDHVDAPTPAAPAPMQTTATVPAPVQAVPTAPVQAAPVAAPTYSIEDIARAGAMLAQQGPEKLAQLNGLLQQFGIPSVTALPKEQMGAFVTAMRGLGAVI